MSGIKKDFVFVCFLLFLLLLVSPVSSLQTGYSVDGFSESDMVKDSKAPVPLDFWQVSPVVLIAVLLTIISPSLVIVSEILLAGLGIASLNFRRVEKRTVLDNEMRGKIYSFIVENPGVCFTDIEKGMSVNRGTLEYHLGILKREHRIAVLTKKRRGFYFENSGKYSACEMEIYSALRNDTGYAICDYLMDCPGACRDDIVSFAKMTCSTVSWHMKRLLDSGAVFTIKDGRIVSYYLSRAAKQVIGEVSNGTDN